MSPNDLAERHRITCASLFQRCQGPKVVAARTEYMRYLRDDVGLTTLQISKIMRVSPVMVRKCLK